MRSVPIRSQGASDVKPCLSQSFQPCGRVVAPFCPGSNDPRPSSEVPDDVDVPACRNLILSMGSLSTGSQCCYTACVVAHLFYRSGEIRKSASCSAFTEKKRFGGRLWRHGRPGERAGLRPDKETRETQAEGAEKPIFPDQPKDEQHQHMNLSECCVCQPLMHILTSGHHAWSSGPPFPPPVPLRPSATVAVPQTRTFTHT